MASLIWNSENSLVHRHIAANVVEKHPNKNRPFCYILEILFVLRLTFHVDFMC